MDIDFRFPNITAETEAGQLAQMKSYMYQLVQQLNWALNTLDSPSNENDSVTNGNGSNSDSSVEDAESTFSSVKALIIKSADIVNAYYDTIKQRLDGIYVAESEFGTFKETTNATLEANSTSISQQYSNIQQITSDVSRLEQAIIDSNAWIKSGLLDYDSDGVPIYGLEVGQKTERDGEEVFNKYARFTAGGIYFYLPGVANAVAWMTGTKLYITNAEITGSLKLGRYICDLSNGIAFKWVGGQ